MAIEYHYLILIVILFFLSFAKGNKEVKFKWACTLTFLFIGLRACVVGADTYNYTKTFLGTSNFYKGPEVELLYQYVYVPLLSGIFKYEQFFILVNTLVSLSPLYVLIKKYSINKSFSILWFFIFGIYVSYFVALRQILGLAFLFWGVVYVCDNKKCKWLVYALMCIVAYGFHTSISVSAFSFVLAYFFQLKSRKMALIVICVSAFCGIIMNSFDLVSIFDFYLNSNLGLTTERLNGYMSAEHQVDGTIGYIFNLRFTWLGLFVYYFIDEKFLNHWFSKIFLMAIIFYNIFYSMAMIMRMELALIVFSIIVVPWALFGKKFLNFKLRNKWAVWIPVLMLAYFTQIYVRSHLDYDLYEPSRLNPYYFFWEDYHTHPSITKF